MKTITISGRNYKATQSALKALFTINNTDAALAVRQDHLSRLVPVLLRSGELRAS